MTFSTEVKVVNVLANVYGKTGEIVRDLTKDDFLLSEDGHPQTIRYFSRETDLPLTLGLLVDTSMSQRRVLDAERIASFRFVDQVLREATDHVFIVQFDMGVEIRQPLTSSRRALESALAQVIRPPCTSWSCSAAEARCSMKPLPSPRATSCGRKPAVKP